MIFDTAVIGAGAAGLFAGACLAESSAASGKTIILEKGARPGRKLLMAGSGQCNLTHSGDMKDFVSHYGPNGKKIRSVLYQFSNERVISFFEERGCPLTVRSDGKVFPRSFQGSQILNILVQSCLNGGVELRCQSPVLSLEKLGREQTGSPESCFRITCGDGSAVFARRVLAASGGCSYPATGSDGSLFPLLRDLGLEIVLPRPALVPLYVERYPYGELSGISFSPAAVILSDGKTGKKIAENQDDLLFTHRCLSGPAILNLSRHARPGQRITVCYLPGLSRGDVERRLREAALGSERQRQLLSTLCGLFPVLPRRFLELLCTRAEAAPDRRAAETPGAAFRRLAALLTEDSFTVSGAGGFSEAMVTSGGVALSAVDLKTMESRACPGLYLAGEVLDVDGDTGGYNLQFAFSSAWLAVRSLAAALPAAAVR